MNSELNKVYVEDRAVHEWYRFVLSFPPHLVRAYMERFHVHPDRCVLDPFCGTGTTVVESKKLGICAIGIEANPMAHFASDVKVDWTPDPDALYTHACVVAQDARRALAADGIEDLPLFEALQPQSVAMRTLSNDAMKLLLSNSISPLPLHKALILRDILDQSSDQAYRRHELLALAKAVVSSASNLHFGPEVGV
ncbi:MAG: DNA methyltransferase, partial [Ktedonobacterales bacterium]